MGGKNKPKENAINVDTLAHAETLTGVQFDDGERKQILESIDEMVGHFQNRRKVTLENSDSPAFYFDPRLSGREEEELEKKLPSFTGTSGKSVPLPASDEDIAYASVCQLSQWIRDGALSSYRLTEIYLKRIKKMDPKLHCVVTLLEDRALEQAEKADEELHGGICRSPLHGIPWGAKDLLDTANIRTTWGAQPYKNGIPKDDSEVVKRLDAAGAVLLAKLSLGALALGDVWYKERTRNPWQTEEGSSGSSAGSASATAAGLVGFSIGSETLGSIVSPCMQCGTTGLRPTFGRVPRAGSMTLSWSFDKIGPICRTVEDTAIILTCINGYNPDEPGSLDLPFTFHSHTPVTGLKVGYVPSWFDDEKATESERTVLKILQRQGFELTEIAVPDKPYQTLRILMLAEAAAVFEELTLSDRDDTLRRQDPKAWPNTFRSSRFIPAIEYIQAQRFRRKVMEMMRELFEGIDILIGPAKVGDLSVITNSTGHPSLTLRAAIQENGKPSGITLYSDLFKEEKLCRVGMTLEQAFDVWHLRPNLC